MNPFKPTILNNDMKLDVKPSVSWGNNITFGKNTRKCEIGFGCFIGNDIYIDVEELYIGDYVTIHHGTVIHGKKCVIGHNNWIGHYCILDSLGGLLKIGNNVGIGAHSQLWTHMQFGDRLAGCQWYRMGELIIEDDAWFVGHCIVSPIHVKQRAMLLVGGVAQKDMQANHIYAGTPAIDITDKVGPQFIEPDIKEKKKLFSQYLKEFEQTGHDTGFIKIVDTFDRTDMAHTQYNLNTRTYLPRYNENEFRFQKFLLYEKAKFIPHTK